ncbi:GGDEF family protein [Sulfuriferula multivorans]|uniref:diguanylate cyclase n=1 Tax=Sulfuriferula multivorans TaxID=1559896 RepID=A0A401JDK1_9PROT|nr:GGDEF domain-containing protein [Sulfuriferula multivorans]GBL45646.1 GGDEF family protein [Sulfuriferula multivorans]
MAKYNTSNLLESVVRLTSLRDQHSLEICLIKTLQELISAGQIRLFEISIESGKKTLKLLVELDAKRSLESETENTLPHCVEDDADLMKCYSTGEKQVSADDGSGVRVVHPITGLNGVIGFLTVRNGVYVEKDQAVAASFLHIYQNYLQLINDNEHDTLTGLLNRKTFDERIMAVMSARRAGRRASDSKEEQCCLAILDIDHFKKVNDQFGHLYGDEVLLLFAQIMTRTFRDDDQLFRYGGEEFVVVLKNVGLDLGVTVLERFRKMVEAYHFPQVGNITASVGVVAISEQDLPTTIIGQADQALYFAKENGRNQVCAYEKLLQAGKLTSVAPAEGDIELF